MTKYDRMLRFFETRMPQSSLRYLVDHTHPALSLFHLARRLDLHRQAVWSEVYSVVRVLFRLAIHLDQQQ